MRRESCTFLDDDETMRVQKITFPECYKYYFSFESTKRQCIAKKKQVFVINDNLVSLKGQTNIGAIFCWALPERC